MADELEPRANALDLAMQAPPERRAALVIAAYADQAKLERASRSELMRRLDDAVELIRRQRQKHSLKIEIVRASVNIAKHGFSPGALIGLPKTVWANYKQASALAMQVDFHRIYLRKIAEAPTNEQRRLSEYAHRHFMNGLCVARGLRPSGENRDKVIRELDAWAVDHADLLLDPAWMPPELQTIEPDAADIAWLLERVGEATARATQPYDAFFANVRAMDDTIAASPLASDVEHMRALDRFRRLIPRISTALDYLRDEPLALAAEIKATGGDRSTLLDKAQQALHLSEQGELAIMAVRNEMRRLFDEPYVASLVSADPDSPYGTPEVERSWNRFEEEVLLDMQDELVSAAGRCEQWVSLLGLTVPAHEVERIDIESSRPALPPRQAGAPDEQRQLGAGE